MTHCNPILMHGWNSMSRVRIQQVSLKACRRWDSMCHRMMTVARIDKPSDLLDSRHRDSSRVALYFGSMEKGSFFGQFWKLGFCSVSECEFFAHGVKFTYCSSVNMWLVFPHNKCLNTLEPPTKIPF